jgi:prepilin-type N-terminal cleavage/methylation domain-containing protein
MKSGQIGRAVREQSGLTLIELLAVIAIIGVLSGIIIPSVSQFGGASESAQAKQDVGTVSMAVTDYNNDKSGVETLSSLQISALIPTVNGSIVSNVTSGKSDLWPDEFITGTTTAPYTVVFATSGTEPSAVTITDNDGNAISGKELLEGYGAVGFSTLVDGGYLQEVPASASAESGDGFPQFLWLLKKKSTPGRTDNSRAVALFELTSVLVADGGGTLPGSRVVILTYEQIS